MASSDSESTVSQPTLMRQLRPHLIGLPKHARRRPRSGRAVRICPSWFAFILCVCANTTYYASTSRQGSARPARGASGVRAQLQAVQAGQVAEPEQVTGRKGAGVHDLRVQQVADERS
jgi:hypothetical protein